MKFPLSVSVNIYKLRKREIQIERNTLTPLRNHQNRKKKLAIFFQSQIIFLTSQGQD